tara:strand:+ start:574 stop:1680 length:1107 start_codon:yes stop_codon:yes gene_type:complete
MKIIHIIPTLENGGAERLVQDICLEINRRKEHEVKLITFQKNHLKLHDLSFHTHVDSTYKPSITGFAEIQIKSLQKIINEFSPNIIHSHLWETEMLLTQVDIGNAKRFSHFHDNIPQLHKNLLPKNKLQIADKYERKIYLNRNENNFICISNDTYNYAKNILPKKLKEKIKLIPNAIDYKKLYSNKKKNFDQINLLNIGSFVPKKNQTFALKILKELNKRGYVGNLIFLGDGPLQKKIKSQASELDLEKNVKFKGNVDNIIPFLNSSNIYLHTANYEPFGLVIVEAMAAGLPVISLDGKGNRDIINNNVNGIIVKDENVDLFVNKIISLFEDQKLYNKFVENGHITAKKYDIKTYVDLLIESYFSAIK